MISKRMMAGSVLLGGIGTVLCGCASIVSGTTQPIAVSAASGAGTNCTLANARGMWEVTTPGTATVTKSKTDVQIHCAKSGFDDGVAVAPSGFEPWTLGNILFGGLVGVGVDWGTGAIHRYPDNVSVPMTPNAGAPAASLRQPPPNAATNVPPTS